jgi:hypothetical protein
VARSRTLTNMLLDVRQRTNQENSTFVTDAELTEYLNQELAELWTRLVLSQGQPHYRTTSTQAVVPGTALYALPSDFWALQEVTATQGGGVFPMRPFMPIEHAGLSNTTIYSTYYSVGYRVQGSNIEFRPATESFTATLYYTPCQPRLTTGTDTFDGFNGFEMCAIAGVCATVLAKEDTDPSFYERQKVKFYEVAEAAAAHRDMASPERVQDVTSDSFGWWP